MPPGVHAPGLHRDFPRDTQDRESFKGVTVKGLAPSFSGEESSGWPAERPLEMLVWVGVEEVND